MTICWQPVVAWCDSLSDAGCPCRLQINAYPLAHIHEESNKNPALVVKCAPQTLRGRRLRHPEALNLRVSYIARMIGDRYFLDSQSESNGFLGYLGAKLDPLAAQFHVPQRICTEYFVTCRLIR
jgi:hypothetical protein